MLAWPVRVTFDFSYEISAYWEQGYGSAYAGVGVPHFLNGSYDMIGFLTNDTGARNEGVVKIFTALPDGKPLILDDFINGVFGSESKIRISVYCEAYAVDETPKEMYFCLRGLREAAGLALLVSIETRLTFSSNGSQAGFSD